MTAEFQEQYGRVERWWERFKTLDEGRRHDQIADNYVDEIYAFFINCYHLKDWIQQDSGIAKETRRSVEEYIDQNRSLKLCADICNALKHVVLTKPPRSDESPEFGNKHYGLKLGPEPATISLKYQVETSNGPIDAFQLATDCIEAWDDFINMHGLS
jgi:hypothetical protein